MSTRILVGEALERLREMPAESVHCCITSPPYWGLRSYEGGDSMIGLEPTFDAHLARLVEVFREVRRVLRADATLWLNYGDAYSTGTTAGRNPTKTADVGGWQQQAAIGPRANDPALKPKDLMMMPARVALALQADGWWLRSKVIWHKPNPMPESCTDRPTSSYEELFLFAKSGSPEFWTHRAQTGVRSEPEPDYVWRNRDTGEETAVEPEGWRELLSARSTPDAPVKLWRRVNLWDGHDYFYDAEAVRVINPHPAPGAPSTNYVTTTDGRRRVDPDRDSGLGAWRARNDGVPRNEYGANLRNVWSIATESFSGWTETCRLERAASDAACDDTMRIGSPGCPVHADQPDRVPKAFCDERVAVETTRILGTHGRPFRVLQGGLAPTDQHRACWIVGERSGSWLLAYSRSAKRRSSGTHRTDHDGETTSPCIACGGTADHTAGTSGSPSSAAPHGCTPESSSGTADLDVRPSARSPDDTSRTPCECSYFSIITEKSSHFATFPQKLVEPCIRAGTSERGVCAQCGAPWVRETNTTHANPGNRTTNGARSIENRAATAGFAVRLEKRVETTGWRPSCECAHDTVPAVVLDCFGGSGTVALVAQKLQRDAILIEISPTYAEMARERIERPHRPKMRPGPEKPLFAEMENA